MVEFSVQFIIGALSMSLNEQPFAAPPEHPGRVKQFYWHSTSPDTRLDFAPHIYFEARIDYSDVRSGYHMTCGWNSVLDLNPWEEDLPLTRDMVRSVDPKAVLPSKPDRARLAALPGFVTEDLLCRLETQYLSFLVRHAEISLLRNYALNIYSLPGETPDEFQARCLESFGESFRGELDAMREVVNRRLERIEQKYAGRDRVGEFESDRRISQVRSRLHAMAESIVGLFLETELSLAPVEIRNAVSSESSRPDFEQSLESLEGDVRRDINRLLNSYQDKIRNIDEYICHPGLKDLHLVRKGILWMPVEAPEA
jgi:hypothetical protein